jgi:hypothetical protein
MIKNAVKIVMAFVIVGLIIGGYLYFRENQETATLLLVSGRDPDGGSPIGRDMMRQLEELQSLTLNDQVFKTAEFRSLRDFSREIDYQPVGRENPFSR